MTVAAFLPFLQALSDCVKKQILVTFGTVWVFGSGCRGEEALASALGLGGGVLLEAHYKANISLKDGSTFQKKLLIKI